MRIILTIIFLTCSLTCHAMERNASLRDGRIVVETPESIKSIDFTMQRGRRTYELKNYTVKEEVDIVEEALKVFKKKQRPVYNKKVWIYERLEDTRSKATLEFMTNEYNEDITFSPDEDFVYYLEYVPGGERRLYGVKIGEEEKFFIDDADNFYIETCDEKKTGYIVVTEDGKVDSYQVYDLSGNKVQTITEINNIDDLNHVICY